MNWRVSIVAIAALVVSALAVNPAGADPRHHRGGDSWRGGGGHNWSGGRSYRPNYNDAGTAFWGGVVGGIFGNMFRPDPPPVIIQQPPVVVVPERTVEWCEAHYRSYNAETGTFTGYDGVQRPCP